MKIIITETQFKKISNFINENDNDNEKLNVLFVGDSHSAGEGWTWNYQLSKAHPFWNVTNIVKVGVKTDWMLSNLKTELQKKHYDLVFILGGTNDMMSSNSIDNITLSSMQYLECFGNY
jgi:lysophospholipase L1-like esterase